MYPRNETNILRDYILRPLPEYETTTETHTSTEVDIVKDRLRELEKEMESLRCELHDVLHSVVDDYTAPIYSELIPILKRMVDNKTEISLTELQDFLDDFEVKAG